VPGRRKRPWVLKGVSFVDGDAALEGPLFHIVAADAALKGAALPQALGRGRKKNKASKGRKNRTLDLEVGMLRLRRGLRFALPRLRSA